MLLKENAEVLTKDVKIASKKYVCLIAFKINLTRLIHS